MKIVNAMFGCGLGGIEQAIVDYSDALLRTGHEVHTVIHPKAKIRSALEKLPVSLHALPNFGAWDPIAILRLRNLLHKIKPDASIAHGNRAVSLLKHAATGPVIGVTHNYKIKCEGLSAIFCPTLDLTCYAEAEGVSEENIYLVPNMVRMPKICNERTRRTPPVIGSMGRFVAKKGFDVFIEALAIMKSHNITFKAVLAGEGKEMESLKALVAQHGLTDMVSLPGWAKDKQAFFDAIDIFCLPSHHEPFGIVLLEAMAEGLPVLSTDSEGPSEIIHNNFDGIIVPKALAGGLIALLSDPDRARKLGRNAYDNVRDNYDVPVVSAKLDLALRDITARNPA